MRLTGSGIVAGSVDVGPKYVNAGNNILGEQIVLPVALLVKQTWTNPVAADDDAYILAAAGPNTTSVTYSRSGLSVGTAFSGVFPTGVPDASTERHARNAMLTVTHASSIVAMSVLVTGIDMHGKTVSETLAVTATGTSKIATGAIAFRRVDSIVATAAADASANTFKVGFGQVFGLEFRNPLAGVFKEVAAGAIVTTGTFVAQSNVATADYRGTYSPATAPDGTKTYVIWYAVDDPTDGIR